MLNADELVLPLDAYNYTTDGYRNFVEAKGRLTRDCLRRFGVEVPVSAWESGELPSFDGMHDRRYGLLDLEAASSRGYQAPDRLRGRQFSSVEELEKHRLSQGAWVPSDEERFLLEGDDFADRPLPADVNGDLLPDGGCIAEAEQVLSGGLPGPRWPVDAGLNSFHHAENDSRVEAAVAAWSDCMGERGYEYSSIWEPNDHDWPEPVTEEEVAVATADVECKRETNLAGTWYAVEVAYQRQFIEEHAEELAELETWLDTVYRSSAEVLGAG